MSCASVGVQVPLLRYTARGRIVSSEVSSSLEPNLSKSTVPEENPPAQSSEQGSRIEVEMHVNGEYWSRISLLTCQTGLARAK